MNGGCADLGCGILDAALKGALKAVLDLGDHALIARAIRLMALIRASFASSQPSVARVPHFVGRHQGHLHRRKPVRPCLSIAARRPIVLAPLRWIHWDVNIRHVLGHGLEAARLRILSPACRQGQRGQDGDHDRNWTLSFCWRHKQDPSRQGLKSGASTRLSRRVNLFTMTSPLPVVCSVAELRAVVRDWKRQGLSVALVPTMGALHDGHLTLVAEAVKRADRVVASNFVNPTQFAAHEDLGSYPRRQEEDARLLDAAGCHLMFAPSPEEMYPEGFATSVVMTGPALGLEGDFRPQMFAGVALVVTKLFNQVQPDFAVFGEKDFQQLMVVRRFVRDLDLPVEVIGMPTARDQSGLALSSRNGYLSDPELETARKLNLILRESGQAVAAGRPIPGVEKDAYAAILKAGFDRVDYVAVRRSGDLQPFADGLMDAPARILVAAWIGKTRLIDNLAI